jgi:hypothetical protein
MPSNREQAAIRIVAREFKMKRSIVRGCVFAVFTGHWALRLRKEKWRSNRGRKDYVAAVKQGEEVKDERATNHEQWTVEVRMVDNGRTIQVHTDPAQWEKLSENDRVKSHIA